MIYVINKVRLIIALSIYNIKKCILTTNITEISSFTENHTLNLLIFFVIVLQHKLHTFDE